MKASTLVKRIAKANPNKTSVAYKLAVEVTRGATLLRTCWTSGKGRFTSNQDYTYATEQLLKKLGVKFESGNDAPKGGLTGNFIKIKTKIDVNS